MTPLQRALIVVGATLTISGVTYLLFEPKEGVTRAQLVAAGFDAEHCGAVEVECEGWLKNECRERPDGGLRSRYVTLRLQAIRCELDAGEPTPPLLYIRSPRMGEVRECFRPLRSVDESCEVIDLGCTDPDICAPDLDEDPPSKPAQNRCACRATDGGNCFIQNPADGGMLNIPRGITVHAPFGGAGCVRKSCTELFGESSLPEECR